MPRVALKNGFRNWGDDGRKIKCQINMRCLTGKRVDDEVMDILVITTIIFLSIRSQNV